MKGGISSPNPVKNACSFSFALLREEVDSNPTQRVGCSSRLDAILQSRSRKRVSAKKELHQNLWVGLMPLAKTQPRLNIARLAVFVYPDITKNKAEAEDGEWRLSRLLSSLSLSLNTRNLSAYMHIYIYTYVLMQICVHAYVNT